MQIDGFTVVAQIINFLVLLALLRAVAYRPILAAVDRREAGISARLRAADAEHEAAVAEAGRHREAQGRLAAERQEILRTAEREAEDRRRELTAEAHAEVDRLRAEWLAALERERAVFLEDLRAAVSDELRELVARSLRQLSDVDLEERLIEVFLQRVRQLDDQDRTAFARAIDEANGRVIVRTSFGLADAARARIDPALRDCFGGGVDVHYEAEPEIALGIEVAAGDRKIGWSVRNYLDELQERTAGLLEAQAK